MQGKARNQTDCEESERGRKGKEMIKMGVRGGQQLATSKRRIYYFIRSDRLLFLLLYYTPWMVSGVYPTLLLFL